MLEYVQIFFASFDHFSREQLMKKAKKSLNMHDKFMEVFERKMWGVLSLSKILYHVFDNIHFIYYVYVVCFRGVDDALKRSDNKKGSRRHYSRWGMIY